MLLSKKKTRTTTAHRANVIFHVIFIVDIIFEPFTTSDAHKDFSTTNSKDDVVNEDNEEES